MVTGHPLQVTSWYTVSDLAVQNRYRYLRGQRNHGIQTHHQQQRLISVCGTAHMFGLPLSTGYSNAMSADLCHPFATPQRNFEQTFGCGHSSDPYGYGLETMSLQRSAANQADAAPRFSETSLSLNSQACHNMDSHFCWCFSRSRALHDTQCIISHALQHRTDFATL